MFPVLKKTIYVNLLRYLGANALKQGRQKKMEKTRLQLSVRCKHCDYELRYNTSTSGMSYHIRNKHRQLYKDTRIAAPGHTVKESIKGKSVMKSYTDKNYFAYPECDYKCIKRKYL